MVGDGLPLAVTMGDPAGVGPSITWKAYDAFRARARPFYVVADPGRAGGCASCIRSTLRSCADCLSRRGRGSVPARPAGRADHLASPQGRRARSRIGDGRPRFDPARGDARPGRQGGGDRHQSDLQGAALSRRLQASRAHGIPGGARGEERSGATAGHDAVGWRAAGGAGHDSPAAGVLCPAPSPSISSSTWASILDDALKRDFGVASRASACAASTRMPARTARSAARRSRS